MRPPKERERGCFLLGTGWCSLVGVPEFVCLTNYVGGNRNTLYIKESQRLQQRGTSQLLHLCFSLLKFRAVGTEPVGQVSSSWQSQACCGWRVWRVPSELLLCTAEPATDHVPRSRGPERLSSSGATLCGEPESRSPPAAPDHPVWGEAQGTLNIMETIVYTRFCHKTLISTEYLEKSLCLMSL